MVGLTCVLVSDLCTNLHFLNSKHKALPISLFLGSLHVAYTYPYFGLYCSLFVTSRYTAENRFNCFRKTIFVGFIRDLDCFS